MARARNIKPGFFTNEVLGGECSAELQLLFAALWCMADRKGRLQDRPSRIKGEMFPHRKWNIDKMLAKLASYIDADGSPFIIRYKIQDRRYIQVVNFVEHQSPHHREPDSRIPDPPAINIVNTDSLGLAQGQAVQENTSSLRIPDCGYRIPDTGFGTVCSEAAPSEPTESAFLVFPCVGKPSEYSLTKSKLQEYAQTFPGVDIQREAREAWQWCQDNPVKRKTCRGMPSFLTRWFAREQDRGGRSLLPRPAARETEEQKKARIRKEREERARDLEASKNAPLIKDLLNSIGKKPDPPGRFSSQQKAANERSEAFVDAIRKAEIK